MAAFATYTAIVVHFKPQQAFDLAAHTSIAVNLAREGKGPGPAMIMCSDKLLL